MKGYEQVQTVLCEKLRETGIPTVPAWTRQNLPRVTEAAAVVGILETESGPAGFGDYLGTAWDETLGGTVERYGKRVRMTLFVDLYAPKGQPEELERAAAALEEALARPMREQLRAIQVRRGEMESDRPGDSLRCRCTVACTAYFTAAYSEEGALLTDFILKGVLEE